jgi:hypothetical protein
MSTIGQKQSVIDAVKSVLGTSFVQGSTKVKEVLAADQLRQVREAVFNGIADGSIAYNKDLSDEKTLHRYVNGMIDNHLRKATELNGGLTYKPTKNGVKRDTQMATLNRLLSTYTEGTIEYGKVKEAIVNREEELKALKNSNKKSNRMVKNIIDKDLLSDELAEIIGKDNF